ncbi:MAG: prepilin-type N-terminal cleavage/methylation domain-containing protein [Caldimicrobium sp.]|nr:prepilin-type N-terminal cleavage/methylation domain-containing protein [Caldimicrobium sp.]MCX7614061.1 prepilin-type N-terminal cleavage/methylation domain-containing protein [Caldimicrobium sp.]MDW8182860.1 prepilin-type N-terminal cleavage/methylation domain-containing protein [Caldimicrobium sp.]
MRDFRGTKEMGFTLVELLIVIAMIAILAAIAIPQYGKYRKSAAENACLSDLRNAITMCVAALSANASKTTCTRGTDYPSSTTNVSSISVTVNNDGSLIGIATCTGAASGTTYTCNVTDIGITCTKS